MFSRFNIVAQQSHMIQSENVRLNFYCH